MQIGLILLHVGGFHAGTPQNVFAIAIGWLLPGVAPTGKPVEMAVAVIAGFKDGKISHEHICRDQASVLVQIGLLNSRGLPVSGAECARKVVDPNLPARKI